MEARVHLLDDERSVNVQIGDHVQLLVGVLSSN